MAVCVDPSGDVYLGGLFTATSNIGGANLASSGPNDMFVAKYSGANGSYVWGVTKGGTMVDYTTKIDCDATKVVVSGHYTGTTNLGGTDIAPQGGSDDFFLAAYNPANGNHLWSVGHGGNGYDNTTAIDLEGGAVYVVGHHSGTISLGGPTRTNAGMVDMFVAKYDSGTGAYVWDKTFGDTQADYANAVKAIGQNVVVTGSFPTKIDFGNGEINSAGGDDLFVATLSQTNGSYVDAWRLGGSNSEKGYALAEVGGNPIVGGIFAGVVYFGSTEATSKGGWDSFVFKRKPQ